MPEYGIGQTAPSAATNPISGLVAAEGVVQFQEGVLPDGGLRASSGPIRDAIRGTLYPGPARMAMEAAATAQEQAAAAAAAQAAQQAAQQIGQVGDGSTGGSQRPAPVQMLPMWNADP